MAYLCTIIKGERPLSVYVDSPIAMAMSVKTASSLPGTRASSPFFNRFVTRRPVNFLRKSHHDAPFSRQRVGLRTRTIVRSVLETEKSTKIDNSEAPVKLIALVGKGAISPLKSTSWEEVMLHTVSHFLLLSITKFDILYRVIWLKKSFFFALTGKKTEMG